MLSAGQLVLVAVAGVAAGIVNVLVGSATLFTFPILLALGLPPVAANVTNTLGLVPGSVAGGWGYRRELAGQRSRLMVLCAGAAAGGLAGAVLLLALPTGVFDAVVPGLVLLACVLVVLQPLLARRAAAVRTQQPTPRAVGPGLLLGVTLSGVYGGYFGAAQGVLLLALLGLLLDDDLQRVNAVKNVLAAVVNGVAAVVFMIAADVRWEVAGVLAVGAAAGGLLGARIGRRLPAVVLRGLVVTVGIAALVALLLT